MVLESIPLQADGGLVWILMRLFPPQSAAFLAATAVMILFTTYIMYIIKEHRDRNRGRYHAAITLQIEIRRIMNVIPGQKHHNSHSTDIYLGLLNSGNIKYFDKELQIDLDDMYSKYRTHGTHPDKTRCKKMLEKLTKIENRGPGNKGIGIGLRNPLIIKRL